MAEMGTGIRRCDEGMERLSREYQLMQSEINDAALDYLLTRAGLDLTDEQKAELKTVHAALAALAERVRKPRGRMAEPAHVYDFAEENLT